MTRRHIAIRSTFTAAAVLLVAAGTALGAVRDGTDGDDTLVGTHRADTFDGKVGNDLLTGLGGNDLYHFHPNSGQDTIKERASHKVGDKVVPGGTDTVSFADVTGSRVQVWLIPEWGRRYNRASRNEEYTVEFGASPIENATGTAVGYDELHGGGGPNTLHPGGGRTTDFDLLADYGGWRDGALGRRGLPASNDRYTGFAEHGGRVYVRDWGGTADVLDLRPLALTDVRVERVDVDNTPEKLESLQITEGDGSGVIVLGHFGEWGKVTTESGQQGRVEKLVFADGTFDAAAAANRSAASANASRGGQDDDLAKAAERLTAAAREDLNQTPPPRPGRDETPGEPVAAGDEAGSTARSDGPAAAGEDADDRRGARADGPRAGDGEAEDHGHRNDRAGGERNDDSRDGAERRH